MVLRCPPPQLCRILLPIVVGPDAVFGCSTAHMCMCVCVRALFLKGSHKGIGNLHFQTYFTPRWLLASLLCSFAHSPDPSEQDEAPDGGNGAPRA